MVIQQKRFYTLFFIGLLSSQTVMIAKTDYCTKKRAVATTPITRKPNLPKRVAGVPIDAAGYVIDTPGVYCISEDLFVNGGTGITISANDVLLDGQGYNIVGSGDDNEFGVVIEHGFHNIRVQNMTLTGFTGQDSVGLTAGGTSNNLRFGNIVALQNNIGIQVIGDDAATCHSIEVQLSNFIENASYGLYFQNCSSVVVAFQSKFRLNGIDGLALRGCLDVQVLGDTISTINTSNGISMDAGCCNVFVRDAQVVQNGESGIAIANSDGIILKNVIATVNGIGFADLGNNISLIIQECIAKQNEGFGFWINSPETILMNSTSDHNISDGLNIGEFSTSSYIKNSVFTNNGGNGITNEGQESNILNNFACNNGGENYVGVELVQSPAIAKFYENADCALTDTITEELEQLCKLSKKVHKLTKLVEKLCGQSS